MIDRPLLLLVEDNPGDVQLVRLAVGECAIEADLCHVENAAQALAFLATCKREARPPALMLLDLNLPRVSGIELLRAVRASSDWRSLPVAVYSSSASSVDIAVCGALGIVSYVVKPAKWGQYLELGQRLQGWLEGGSSVWAARSAAGKAGSASA